MERKLLKHCVACILAVIFACPVARAESNQKLEALKQLVVKAMSYPEATLIATNGPLIENNGYGKVELYVNVSFKSTNNSFHPLLISAGPRENIFPAAEMVKLESVLAEAAAGRKKTAVRKTELDSGAIVYTGLVMAGPGGSALSVLVDYPGKKVGVRMTWSFTNDHPVEIEKAPEDYRKLFSPDSKEADGLRVYIPLAQDVINLVLDSTPSGADKQRTSQPGNDNPANLLPGPATLRNTGNRASAPAAPSPWPWLAAGLLVIVALVIAVKRRN